MTDRELLPLRHAAAGELLFHTGRWGGPAGYRWRGPDGTEAGLVPPWETEELDRLHDRGLISVERRLGPSDRPITATEAGIAALTTSVQAA
ncbi:MAG: hypothetical protein ACRDSE_19735 [Pseudonocardiaceae bacterium]